MTTDARRPLADSAIPPAPGMGLGRGKVILLGEHAVVYGRPALAAGLAHGVEATAHAAPDGADTLGCAPWNVTVTAGSRETDERALLLQAFEALLATYPADRSAVSVDATIALPGGAGLGCSAALGVAVMAALDAHYGVVRTPAERGVASLVWERVFHGNPSGLDNAMAAVGGVAVYRRGEPLVPVTPARPITLVVGHSGESSSTKEMVDLVARQHGRDPARVDQIFDAIASLVDNGARAVARGDVRALGQLFTLNQTLLSSLLLSTDTLEAMCAAAKDAGAFGAKVTGAGGGGCMIAIADAATAQAVCEAVGAAGRDALIAEVGPAGAPNPTETSS